MRCSILRRVQALKPIQMVNRGCCIAHVYGETYTSGQFSPLMGEKMRDTIKNGLRKMLKDGPDLDLDSTIHCFRIDHESSASGAFITLETDTGCLFHGESSAENLASGPMQAAYKALDEIKNQLTYSGCVDEHIQDQLIQPMTLAKGISRMLTGDLTLHTKTAIFVARRMTGARIRVFSERRDSAKVKPNDDDGLIVEPMSRFPRFPALLNSPEVATRLYMIQVEGIQYSSSEENLKN